MMIDQIHVLRNISSVDVMAMPGAAKENMRGAQSLFSRKLITDNFIVFDFDENEIIDKLDSLMSQLEKLL